MDKKSLAAIKQLSQDPVFINGLANAMLLAEEYCRELDLAEHCGVSEITIRRYKEPILHNVQDTSKTKTVTRKGKAYEQKTANIGKKQSEPKTESVPESKPEPESPAAEVASTIAPEPTPETVSPIRRAVELLEQSPSDVAAALAVLKGVL